MSSDARPDESVDPFGWGAGAYAVSCLRLVAPWLSEPATRARTASSASRRRQGQAAAQKNASV